MYVLKVTTSNDEGVEISHEYPYIRKWMAVDSLLKMAQAHIAAAPDIPDGDLFVKQDAFAIYNGDTKIEMEIKPLV